MRRRAVILLTAVMTAGALAIGAGATSADASVASKKAPACAGSTKKKAVAAIKTAYTHFLNGKKFPANADKEPFIQFLSGKKLNAALKAQFEASNASNAAAAATTDVAVKKVTCTGKNKATVNFDLVLSGTDTPGLAPPGAAIIEGGVWKVTALTLCNLQALGDSSVLEKAPCSDIVASG